MTPGSGGNGAEEAGLRRQTPLALRSLLNRRAAEQADAVPAVFISSSAVNRLFISHEFWPRHSLYVIELSCKKIHLFFLKKKKKKSSAI